MIENVPKAMNPEFHECVNPAQQLGVVFYCFYKVCAEELPFGMDFTHHGRARWTAKSDDGPVMQKFEIQIKIALWVVYL